MTEPTSINKSDKAIPEGSSHNTVGIGNISLIIPSRVTCTITTEGMRLDFDEATAGDKEFVMEQIRKQCDG